MPPAGVVGVGCRVSLSLNLPVMWFVSLGPLVWVELVQGLDPFPHPVLGREAISAALGRGGYEAVVF